MAHSFYAFLAPPIVVGVLLTCQSLDPEYKTAFFQMHFQEEKNNVLYSGQYGNPQRPQQLRCWEKMKTLMFSLASKQSIGIACKTLLTLQLLERGEKMKDNVTAEGRNYSNAGLSINPPSEM